MSILHSTNARLNKCTNYYLQVAIESYIEYQLKNYFKYIKYIMDVKPEWPSVFSIKCHNSRISSQFNNQPTSVCYHKM